MLAEKSVKEFLLHAGRRVCASTGLAIAALCVISTVVFAEGAITVTTSDDEFNTGGPLSCSLREAIESANTDTDFGGCLRDVGGSMPYDVIVPAPIIPGPYTLNFEGANEDDNATGDLDIRASMRIIGDGGMGLIIVEAGASAQAGMDRVFHITTDDLEVTFSNIVVRHGQVAAGEGDSGGGIANTSNSTVLVENSHIINNIALGAEANQGGGGLLNELGGTLIISNSVVADNQAIVGSGSGGGILNRGGGMLMVYNSEISGNQAARAGGGIETNNAPVSLHNVTLLSNMTGPKPGNGGGLHSTGASDVTMVTGVVMSNTATAEGGGLWNSITGTMTIDNVAVVGNVASGKEPDQGGGGLFNDGGALTVMHSVIQSNMADGLGTSGGGILNMPGATGGSGGGILNTAAGTLVVRDTVIEGNSAIRAGGGIEDNASTTLLIGVDLIANVAGPKPGNGGGFHSTGASMVTIRSGVVMSNTAAAEGGGLWNSGAGTMLVNDVVVAGNRADGTGANRGGGGIFNVGGPLSVSHSTIVENSAMNNGGGIKVIGGDTVVSHVTLADNRADGDISTLVAMTGTITLSNSFVGTLGEAATPLCSGNVSAPTAMAEMAEAENVATDDSCGTSLVTDAFLGDTITPWWQTVR